MSFLSRSALARPAQLRTVARISGRSFSISHSRKDHFLDVDKKQFDERVTNGGSKLVLVDFYAGWCGPCKTLSPLLEKITSDSSLVGGKELDLVTVDTESQTELAQLYQITSLPTVFAFKDGKRVDHFVGALPMPRLVNFVKGL